jgi:ribonuclease T2
MEVEGVEVRATLFLCIAILLESCSTSVGPAPSQTATARPPVEEPQNPTVSRKHRHKRTVNGASGTFDFYVMSLSWSPGFCATPAGRGDAMQCGSERPYGFVLHGFWPQYEAKGWPEDCTTERVDHATVENMLSIMPSPKLVEHEWQKHGTCSGLAPKDYFEEATEAFHSVKIPAQYQSPTRTITVSPDRMLHDFVAANPMFGDQGFAVLCSSNGRYLTEVRGCLSTDLEGRRCNQEVLQDQCRSPEMIMRPIR